MLPAADEPLSFIIFVDPTAASSKPILTVYIDPVQKDGELSFALDAPEASKHAENGDREARLSVLRGVKQIAGQYREAFSWEVLPSDPNEEAAVANATAVRAAMEEAGNTDAGGLDTFVASCWRTARFAEASTGRFPRVFPIPSPYSDN
jgi:hypothetical protein